MISRRNQPEDNVAKAVAASQSQHQANERPTKKVKPKYRNPTSKKSLVFDVKQVGLRFIIMVGLIFCLRYFVENPTVSDGKFASIDEQIGIRFHEVPCSKDYTSAEKQKFKGCIPEICGRAVMDNVISKDEAEGLLRIAKSGLAMGGSSGGASILDLHSGALSHQDKFINIYSVLKSENSNLFLEEDFKTYARIREKIQLTISNEFGIPRDKLYLTYPTFFSRMTTAAAKTMHDEYWHPHVDKETYGTFHYTSLLYLSTHGKDFTGGRFTFIDKDTNKTIEPKLGRLSFFTSGSENRHFVEKLQSGIRYAATVSFTCDKNSAIKDPQLIDKLK